MEPCGRDTGQMSIVIISLLSNNESSFSAWVNHLKDTSVCKTLEKNLVSLGFWWMKIWHCFIGFLSWIVPKLKAIKIKNHLVIPSECLCGYITPCFALWEIYPCLFSTVKNHTPQSQRRLSAEEHVYVGFVSCSFTELRKRCRTNTSCSSFGTRMIWTPIMCRWCYIIASGILDGSLQITVKLCKPCRTSLFNYMHITKHWDFMILHIVWIPGWK